MPKTGGSLSVRDQALAAKEAAKVLRNAPTELKNRALFAMADALDRHKDSILQANFADVAEAQTDGLSKALLDRLTLTEARLEDAADGLREVAALADPIGEVVAMGRRPNGLEIGQVRVPLGVVGIIYEARPNVTVDAAGLCLKAGNTVILRGGREAIRTNIALVDVMGEALADAGLPKESLAIIQDIDRSSTQELMRLSGIIDVLIPRGGRGLIQAVRESATVPVIETGEGNCHIYIDYNAPLDMALEIIINAKCQRPGVCNAVETLLIHTDVAGELLPVVASALTKQDVVVKGCAKSLELMPSLEPADPKDWETEYLDLILAVKIVDDLEDALTHIEEYGTGHSEAIVTNDYRHAAIFREKVDAAAVYVNASTRFTDGQEFGLGAEIGISTQKLHARGPMGLKELTSTKFVIAGSGQIRI
ncbi:MAG: glutamate-5-semialdehyde dehydrogenase [Firmicutes bacterium]|nr:glutamate-5-semialdehyde dehydrogenase [Bacillota bacterium]